MSGRTKKVLAAIAVAIPTILGGLQLYDRVFPDDPPNVTVAYVMDTSRAMRGKIGDQTKFAAVRAEVLRRVGNSPDIGAGLRFAGGTCGTGRPKPAVDFGDDRADEFERALDDVRPRGRSDFARAIENAVNDLQRSKSPTKTLVVYLAGDDECDPDPAQTIRDSVENLRQDDVRVNFRFFGVKVSRRVRSLLRRIRRETKKAGFAADVRFATRRDQLAAPLPGS